VHIDAYLENIGFVGEPKPDLETLSQIHQRHLLTIPFENIDVQLNRAPDLDIGRIYAKIVEGGRGGWCFEMNGLLEWALREVGFDVLRLAGGVLRAHHGDAAFGNHLLLRVQLEQAWIADVGFGDGFFEPVLLREQTFEQRGFSYRLESLDDGWRFHNHASGAAETYDFRVVPADEALLAEHSAHLSHAAESPFVANLVCQKFVPHGYDIQVGRVAKQVTPQGKREWLIDSADELLETLSDRFGLDVPEIAGLWDRIEARHEELFPSK